MSARVKDIYQELKEIDNVLDDIADAQNTASMANMDSLVFDDITVDKMRSIIVKYKNYLEERLVL